MAKEQTIFTVWPEFVKSAAYQDVNIYPDGLIKESVKYFNDLLTSQFPLAWSQWQINEISLTMHAFVEQGLFDLDPDAIEILNATYAAIRAFLRFLVAADKIKVSSAQLEGLLAEVEDEDGQITRDSADVDALPRVVDLGDGLPQWQAATMEKLLHYTRDWVAAYFESATWKKRKLNVSEELLSTLVETLSVSAYVDYRKTPKSWTKTAIVGVMTDTFVTETEFSDDEYLMIAPALKAFIGFVGQKGWLNAKRASDYQRYISAGEPVMLGLAQDQDDDDTGDDFGDDVNDLLKYPEALTALAKAIDPDSDQDYLKEHQQQSKTGVAWQRQRAIETHQKGLEAGIKLAIPAANYDIPTEWAPGDVLQTVSEVVDMMYQQAVELPSEWTPQAWGSFVTWLKTNEEPDNYQNIVLTLSSLMQLMTDEDVLTAARAQQIVAAMHQQSFPTGGNVVSLADRRKQRHPKK